MVESNKEYGDGRSDVVVKDQINGRVAVFEAKYTRQPVSYTHLDVYKRQHIMYSI